MNRLTDNLDSIAEQIQLRFSAQDEAREKALTLCRDIIRHCGRAIRAVHRQEFDQATGLLKSAYDRLNEAKQIITQHSELSHAGWVRDAQKEFAEASITLALVVRKQLPSPDELGVDSAAYLNGLGETVGELRRYLLDSMRKGDLSRGEEILSAMDDIYSTLVTMDFPEVITGGLRRTTDAVRGILERTRSDLTLVMRQKDLEDRLKKTEELSKFNKKKGA